MSAAPQLSLPTVECGPEHGFHPGTKVPKWTFNFVYNDEGMGGYLNYAAVTTWLAKNYPWLEGRVWCEQFLVPLVKDIHAPFKNWQVLPMNQFQQLRSMHKGPTIGPLLTQAGMQAKREFTTAIGTHPIDVGCGYYAATGRAPAGVLLPVLDYPLEMITEKFVDHKVRRRIREAGHYGYVVFTAGGTTPIRTMTGEHLNPLIDFVKAKGLLPVFLGKKDILADGKATTTFVDTARYDDGLDLRDKTTVKEAACIMQHAAATVGLDGGLLHLAALMQNSRIVFGYNITSVEHREPRRNHGRTINVTLTEKELICIGCQSKWKNMFAHSYDECFYAKGRAGFDPAHPERARACLRVLFENESSRFKRAIEEAIA